LAKLKIKNVKRFESCAQATARSATSLVPISFDAATQPSVHFFSPAFRGQMRKLRKSQNAFSIFPNCSHSFSFLLNFTHATASSGPFSSPFPHPMRKRQGWECAHSTGDTSDRGFALHHAQK
jgi:hypothetical protein